jgi:hypothetical protein
MDPPVLPPERRQAAATQYDNDYDPITDDIDVPMDLHTEPTPQFDDITLRQNTPPDNEEENEDDSNTPNWGGRKYKRSCKKRRTRRRKTRRRKKTKRR